jgi:hypothetical protein
VNPQDQVYWEAAAPIAKEVTDALREVGALFEGARHPTPAWRAAFERQVGRLRAAERALKQHKPSKSFAGSHRAALRALMLYGRAAERVLRAPETEGSDGESASCQDLRKAQQAFTRSRDLLPFFLERPRD